MQNQLESQVGVGESRLAPETSTQSLSPHERNLALENLFRLLYSDHRCLIGAVDDEKDLDAFYMRNVRENAESIREGARELGIEILPC